MRQQCGGVATIHRRESENQAVAGSLFCHQIGTPASLLEARGSSEDRGRRGLEYRRDSPMSTLYHILGLSQDASREQVKAAFRTLARRFHPDVNIRNDAAEQRFKEVSQAYETLADPEARAAYDRALVCRAAETQRQRWTFAATAAATFALTTAIGLALWWILATREPEQAGASVLAGIGHAKLIGAQPAAPEEAKVLTAAAAPPAGRGKGSGWATYNNVRFGFALKYPGDVFAYDIGPSDGNVRILGSRDGRAKLHIFAEDNGAGTTLAQYRRSRMEAHYAGAVFDFAPQRRFEFVLSGTQGEKAFYERVTFACNNRAIHGWQIVFPASQRTLYHLLADAVNRSYTHKISAGSRCSEPRRVSENNARPRLH
jgi:curved DNA-binding protein CbpA